MSRYTDPKCRLCRREGVKLYLKGERCEGPKCALTRRNYPPGLHGKGRFSKPSEYATQLREKQKAKRMFGVLEKQFRLYYDKASRKNGITGDWLLTLLELRLDSVVYRSGLTSSRNQARQLINHGVFYLNGKRVTIPSISVKVGDKFEVRKKNSESNLFKDIKKGKVKPPKWLKADPKALSGEVLSMPERDDLEASIESSLIVEYYSK